MEITRITVDIQSDDIPRIKAAAKIDKRSRNSFVIKSVMDRVNEIELKVFKRKKEMQQ